MVSAFAMLFAVTSRSVLAAVNPERAILKLDMIFTPGLKFLVGRRQFDICKTSLSGTAPWPATLTVMPEVPAPMVTL